MRVKEEKRRGDLPAICAAWQWREEMENGVAGTRCHDGGSAFHLFGA